MEKDNLKPQYGRILKTADGEIEGKVVFNEMYNKYQVYIDGALYEEFDTFEEAKQNLLGAGFDKEYEEGGEIEYANGGQIKETEIKVGSVFKLPNGETITVIREFKENGGDDWVESVRSGGKYQQGKMENSIKGLKNFLNTWKATRVEIEDKFFPIDSIVYNTRTKTVGIVRLSDEKGETKTDADGNVNTSELELYNLIKHPHQEDAIIAPSIVKEVNERGLYNPFSGTQNISIFTKLKEIDLSKVADEELKNSIQEILEYNDETAISEMKEVANDYYNLVVQYYPESVAKEVKEEAKEELETEFANPFEEEQPTEPKASTTEKEIKLLTFMLKTEKDEAKKTKIEKEIKLLNYILKTTK